MAKKRYKNIYKILQNSILSPFPSFPQPFILINSNNNNSKNKSLLS